MSLATMLLFTDDWLNEKPGTRAHHLGPVPLNNNLPVLSVTSGYHGQIQSAEIGPLGCLYGKSMHFRKKNPGFVRMGLGLFISEGLF